MIPGSPTKNTGGGGFVVENRVVAYYLAAMLARAPVDAELGELVRVSTQQQSAGWLGGLDDVVITFGRTSEITELALSVKSYAPFSGRSAPRDFITATWRHILGIEARKLGDGELVGMAVGPTPSRVRSAFGTLLAAARLGTPEALEARLATPGASSDEARDIYASLACPAEFAESLHGEDTRAWRLLRKLRIVYFDLEDQQSLALEAALSRCRFALESGDANEAQSLWTMLLAIGDELRPAGGSISRDELLTRVAKLHSLRERPDHSSDLKRLAQIGKEERERVRDTIGSVRLQRAEARSMITAALATFPTVALVGSAGTGKSALAKLFVDDLEGAFVVWLAGDRLEARTLPEISAALGLKHPLDELLLDHPATQKLLVVDGLDRASWERLATFGLLARRLIGASTGWNVLLTARADEWQRLEADLLAANYPADSLGRVDVDEPSSAELEPVWDAHPGLQPLSLRPQLRTLLLKPKVLDLMARHESRRPDVSKWVGESDLVEWFWQEEVDRGAHGIARGEALKRLAERQGDELEAETPLSAIDTSGLEELRQYELVRISEERVSFGHDLYGDWARERVVLGNSGNFVSWVSPRLANPPWHRAARLYALSLIEQGKLDDWRKLLAEASESDPVLADLIVESSIFAADPVTVLELIWDDLAAAKGRLLRRLLNRLLFVATLPNPSILVWAASRPGLAPSEAATLSRIPFPPYWPPVLRFLAAHQQDVVELALIPLVQMCDIWLRRGDPRFPQRREAAELALAAAETLYAERRKGVWMTGGIDETAYRAALAGGGELPDEVGDLALRLVRRRDVDDVATYETEWPGVRRELPPPWPIGPSEQIDESVEKVMLSPDGLMFLFHGAPRLAREALVATLVEAPTARDLGELRMPGEELGLEGRFEWHSPNWFRGPFISLLREAPDEGITAILQLADFATERWGTALDRSPPTVTVSLTSGRREFVGDAGLFVWYRGTPAAPETLVVALMALERFLYEQIEAERPIDALLERILAETGSVSVLGVLVAAACYQPALAEGPLQPLICVPELLVWDRHQKFSEQLQSSLALQISMPSDPEELRSVAIEWQTMPHRRRTLEDVALELMLSRKADALFDEFLRKLQADADELAVRGAPFKRLLTIFERERYVAFRDDDGTIYLTIPPTEEQVAEAQQANEETMRSIAALDFVPRLRHLLDGEITITAEELPQLWQSLREREGAEPPGDFEPGFLTNEAALCGGIAVLLTFHRDWVADDPERERWCRETLFRVLESPPPGHYMTNDSHGDGAWAWDRFAAQAFAVLLAEDPCSEELRLAAAHFACFRRYSTVATLFRALAERRQELGHVFGDLRDLALWWATRRPRLRDEKAREGIMAELIAVAEDFARGGRAPKAQWDELVEVAETESDVKRRRTKRRRPVADITQIESSHSWLPELNKARDEDERAEWVAFWRRALAFELGILGVSGSNEGDEPEVQGSLYSFDRWLLGQLAGITLDMRDDEDPASIWRPILDISSVAERWVEPFLRSWFLYGFAEKPVPTRFLSRWREMIEHAMASPRWKLGDWHYRQEELWHMLLGLDWSIQSAWTREQRPTVLALKDLYERWAAEGLASRWGVERFARFLWRTEAGQAIQFEGLVWLDRAAAKGFWSDRDAQDELARLLDAAWGTGAASLGSATEAGQAFRRLLRLLAEAQNSLALALISRAGGI